MEKNQREQQIQERRMDQTRYNIPKNFNNLEEYFQWIKSGIEGDKVRGAPIPIIELRKLLSGHGGLPIKQVVDAGFLPFIVKNYLQSENRRLKCEGAWCLVNLTTIDDEEGVIRKIGSYSRGKLFEVIVEDIQKERIEVELLDNLLMVVSNVMAENARYRDYFLDQDIIGIIVGLIERHIEELGILVNGVAIIANSIRHEQTLDFRRVEQCISLLKYLLHNPCDDVKEQVFWAFGYMLDHSKKHLEFIRDRTAECIMEFVNPRIKNKLLFPALRFVGSYTDQSDEIIESIVELGLPKCLAELTKHGEMNVRKEAIWALSNFMGSSKKVQQKTFNTKVDGELIVVKIIEILKLTYEQEIVKNQCVWFLGNTFSKAPKEAIELMILKLGVANVLSDQLFKTDPKYLESVLRAINELFARGIMLDTIKENGIKKRLLELSDNANGSVKNLLQKILRNFFPEKENKLMEGVTQMMEDLGIDEYCDDDEPPPLEDDSSSDEDEF